MRSLSKEILVSLFFLTFIGVATVLIYLAHNKVSSVHSTQTMTNTAFIVAASSFGVLTLGSLIYFVYNDENHQHPGRMFAHILVALTLLGTGAVGILCIIAAYDLHHDKTTGSNSNHDTARDYLIAAAVLMLGEFIGYSSWLGYTWYKHYKFVKNTKGHNTAQDVPMTLVYNSPQFQQPSPQYVSPSLPVQQNNNYALTEQEKEDIRRSVHTGQYNSPAHISVDIDNERYSPERTHPASMGSANYRPTSMRSVDNSEYVNM